MHPVAVLARTHTRRSSYAYQLVVWCSTLVQEVVAVGYLRTTYPVPVVYTTTSSRGTEHPPTHPQVLCASVGLWWILGYPLAHP